MPVVGSLSLSVTFFSSLASTVGSFGRDRNMLEGKGVSTLSRPRNGKSPCLLYVGLWTFTPQADNRFFSCIRFYSCFKDSGCYLTTMGSSQYQEDLNIVCEIWNRCGVFEERHNRLQILSVSVDITTSEDRVLRIKERFIGLSILCIYSSYSIQKSTR